MAKNVVITGATSGIGEAIARAYLEQGEDVVLTGRRIDRLEILKSEFAVSFPNQTVWTFPLDVTDMVMVKTVCSDILETIGRIDILVNNAGLISWSTTPDWLLTWLPIKTMRSWIC
ncbi:3-oxoacyl-ACP reductase [Streptococcus pneumoniae]|nr:3-oxoacyl-ACP reductase [Streptococcus pneumoniae]